MYKLTSATLFRHILWHKYIQTEISFLKNLFVFLDSVTALKFISLWITVTIVKFARLILKGSFSSLLFSPLWLEVLLIKTQGWSPKQSGLCLYLKSMARVYFKFSAKNIFVLSGSVFWKKVFLSSQFSLIVHAKRIGFGI